MPNYITNILFITGVHDDRLEEIRNHVRLDNRDFSFQAFFPMPEALAKTSSPVRIVTQEEYNQIMEANKERQESWRTYALTKEMQKDLLDKYGYDNWYNWKLDHWGTKWDAMESQISYDFELLNDIIVSDVEILEHFNEDALDENLTEEQLKIKSLLLSSNYDNKVIARNLHQYKDFPSFEVNPNYTLMYKFETAWSTPFPALKVLSKEFPNIEFHIAFADEDTGSNCGFYTILNGEITLQLGFEHYCIESVQYACLVCGYDFDEMYTIENGDLKWIDC